jgi:hypothetical protein
MNTSRRVVVAILFISVILLVGMLFGPFILNEIITPMSLVVWLLLRMFVLSIGQQYYWGAIIFVVLIFLVRFLPQDQINVREDDSPDLNSTITTIGYWRNLFILTEHDARSRTPLKRELVRLLLSLYASKQRTSANFGLYEALQRGEIPLPDHIHTFLFLDEPKETGRSIRRLMQTIRNTPQKWIRRWTGQETAEYYQMIDEVLCFIETSLEMKNDDGKLEPN